MQAAGVAGLVAGLLEAPAAGGDSAGKRTLYMSKQLTGKELWRSTDRAYAPAGGWSHDESVAVIGGVLVVVGVCIVVTAANTGAGRRRFVGASRAATGSGER